MEKVRYPEQLIFGLDIGTRSVIGIVGYKENTDDFKVVAHVVKEHDTRAMLDGQIHDIAKVSSVIKLVKEELEEQVGVKLTEVCIAAAGRVLKTITVKADYEFPSETTINEEHIHSLNLLGVEKAYDIIRQSSTQEKTKFYCVGYSVIRYYMNDYIITALEGHKAGKITSELIATFLPEDVIDGLYASVEKAGLDVANLTLEPIAAITVAIPEKFRLLNIALVDVGAGTSDISITKDGSIIAYGMIPYAGDEITEYIANKCLVDFNTAEKIKTGCLKKKMISYKDIMGISHKISKEDVLEMVRETEDNISKQIADKIMELNGNSQVSAVFIVGGGGKILNFDVMVAKHIGIPPERVALRGAEVLKTIEFLQPKVKKDSILVTPVGICLSFYEQKNNFIFVMVNGERVKLYDNSKLVIVDAALQIGFPNEQLFPRRGKPLNFKVDNKKRFIRGEAGEAAIVKLNGEVVGLNTRIVQNDKIEIIESTVGPNAEYQVRQLPEYTSIIEFIFNGQNITCPKFVMVNNQLVSEFYNIQENDKVQIVNYYTLRQVLEFMDLDFDGVFYVNNVIADLDEKIYDRFTIDYEKKEKEIVHEVIVEEKNSLSSISIFVNKTSVVMTGKEAYILVDVLDFYHFDLSVVKGSRLVITINGVAAEFTDTVKENDVIDIYWEE